MRQDIKEMERSTSHREYKAVQEQGISLLTEMVNTLKKKKSRKLLKLLLCLAQMKEKLMQIVSCCSPSRQPGSGFRPVGIYCFWLVAVCFLFPTLKQRYPGIHRNVCRYRSVRFMQILTWMHPHKFLYVYAVVCVIVNMHIWHKNTHAETQIGKFPHQLPQ